VILNSEVGVVVEADALDLACVFQVFVRHPFSDS